MESKEAEACFHCLERRVKSDFSDKIVFSHGLSDSPLPFGFAALVQVSASENDASQLILEYMQRTDHGCLARYVDDYDAGISESLSNNADDSNKANATVDDAPICLSNSNDSQPLSGVGEEATCACEHSQKFCWRTTSALAPIAQVGTCSPSVLEEISSDYLSGRMEEHVLCSLNLLIEEKGYPRDAVNFFRLLGLPSFEVNSTPGCLRHPNLAPTIGLLKSSDCIVSVLPKAPYTLENIFYYSPDVFVSDRNIDFLMYQLLSALNCLHGLGMSHRNICPSTIMLTDSLWMWLLVRDHFPSLQDKRITESNFSPLIKGWCTKDCYSYGLYADLKLSPSLDWRSHFHRWWRGELSNFEYLLYLNKLAGRRWGDHTFHPVMPWVIDFSRKPDEDSDSGWRDLCKSKWRLAKGDEQLDFTYLTSEIPHHVSDECLSELAVCSYKARRLPLSILRSAVRSVYEPNEYPSNMQRLYQWTPDECIPEFYSDPQIFYSIHTSMADLAVPQWAGTPEEFVKLHREALESHHVSSQIHNWIDIIFGYKMSGQAAIDAKNVMLLSSELARPRSVGRRQLFTQPHPKRLCMSVEMKTSRSKFSVQPFQLNGVDDIEALLPETAYLERLEEASAFCEHASQLSPCYIHDQEKILLNPASSGEALESKDPKKNLPSLSSIFKDHAPPFKIGLNYLLEHMEVDSEKSVGYQDLLLWRQRCCHSSNPSMDIADDVFSIGCILAELYLRRPLFDSMSMASYLETGVCPGFIQELPPHSKLVVEACIEKDWRRRPSVKSLLGSPYFSATVKSAYLFVAPLQLLAKDGSRLYHAANLANKGALKAMGTSAAEMCAPYCLPFVAAPLSDSEAEWACILLKEFIKCLTQKAVKKLILPLIQKILQASGYSHLKVSLLQESFVRELRNQIGMKVYLETIHPLVIFNLYVSPHKRSTSAASVLLIGSSEELGVPVTIHQTIIPLIHCFGKGLSPDGIDVLVRIGGLLGENFIVRQLHPLLEHVIRSCINISSMNNKPEPMQSWSSLALTDCLMTLDGLATFLPNEALVKELTRGRSCLHVMVLMQKSLEVSVLQVAATALMAICQRIGPELTELHVLPQLKELFDELAFSQETASRSSCSHGIVRVPKPELGLEAAVESYTDLVLLLYPSFASLIGIEKLRKGCPTWLLLEQYLLRCHSWKWEYTQEASRPGTEDVVARKLVLPKGSTSKYNPSKMLLNGVGWSIPHSQGLRSSKKSIPQKHFYPVEVQEATSSPMIHEPWSWFSSPVEGWDVPDILGRLMGPKDESPWKIRATVLSSVRAHHGALRSLAVCQDECTVFTAGIGSGFKGTVQKWEFTRLSCVSGYYAHEEVVNDICILSSSGRIASCDGTIHVWNSLTGKLITIFSESTTDHGHLVTSASASKAYAEQANMLGSHSMSSGILTSAFDGSMYTCMHHLEYSEKLVVGTGSGSLRFFDVSQGRKLHLWKGEWNESGFSSLVSTLCSGGSDRLHTDGVSSSPPWIAAGLSSGHCRLFDVRSGSVISAWRAHDGYVTKLAAPQDHLLVSSSLDKTVRIWDFRRSWTPQPTVFRGHTDGVSGFSLWGQDVISISRNNIGVFSLSKPADEDGQHRVMPRRLCLAENGARNMSILSAISILPFSRLFLVGTEDGCLKICC